MEVAVVWNGRRKAERASVAIKAEICIYCDAEEAPVMQSNGSLNRPIRPVILKEGFGVMTVHTMLEPTQSTRIIIVRRSTRYRTLKILRKSHD